MPTIEHHLTDDQLAAVLERAADNPLGAIVLCWDLLVPGWEKGPERLRCADHSLPETQWRAICSALTGGNGDPLSRANHMLDWVNVGPSHHPDEAIDSDPTPPHGIERPVTP